MDEDEIIVNGQAGEPGTEDSMQDDAAEVDAAWAELAIMTELSRLNGKLGQLLLRRLDESRNSIESASELTSEERKLGIWLAELADALMTLAATRTTS